MQAVQWELRMKHRWIVLSLALSAFGVTAMAQTVYESRDKAGPVFSDTPSPGASAVVLPPPNVVSPPRVTPAAPAAAASAAPAPHYRTLVISQPEPQGTVHSNTGAFDVRARLNPPLRPSDRIGVRLDGNAVPTLFRSTNLRISETDWRSTATGEGNSEHQLQLVVLDAKGAPLIESEPVRFYVRRAAVGGSRR
jgi:hypothetical protein